jgi:hypothetical protein
MTKEIELARALNVTAQTLGLTSESCSALLAQAALTDAAAPAALTEDQALAASMLKLSHDQYRAIIAKAERK